MSSPFCPTEPQRLAALHRYAILDTPREAAFDRITWLVANVLKASMVAVTLVDQDRLWFKSFYGFDGREISRDSSFCESALHKGYLLEVPDAAKSEIFRDNILVTGETKVRYYAGIPLKSSDGFKLGTLCIMDRQPRYMSEDERRIFSDFAAIVTDELELGRVIREKNQQAAGIACLSCGVVLTDPKLPDNPIVFANEGFLTMTGYRRDEVLGRNCKFLQGEATDPATIGEIRAAIEGRHIYHGEVLNYRENGTPFWNELTVCPVLDRAGELINFVGLQNDITGRKRTSEELRKSYEKIQAIESMRDSLTQMVIHDLRSPLSTIVGYLGMIQMTATEKLSAQENQFVETALHGATTLQEMITSLLDLNRLESGEMPVDLRPVDLREIATAVADSFSSVLGTRTLLCQLPEEPALALCDADLTKRVIANLLNNAIKFTPKYGKVQVTAILEKKRVKISIRDTGKGIPAEAHTRIFEKFGQVQDGATRHSTGLGLTFCKFALEAQGGSIGVESVEGEGSTFWFVLPRIAPAKTAASGITPKKRSSPVVNRKVPLAPVAS